jgi:hypothetical protein
MGAGVPCPPDIKRKMDRNNNKIPGRNKEVEKEEASGKEEEEEIVQKNETNPQIKVSEGHILNAQTVVSQLTSF